MISVYLRTVKANFSSLWTECTLPAAGLGWLSVPPRLKQPKPAAGNVHSVHKLLKFAFTVRK